MVYESDFYSTRRPYSRPSVPITSYSVTHTKLTPGVGKAHTYHPSIPYIAHKRMNNVTTPVPHNSVRKSVIDNTLDRIYHKSRSHPSYDPMEDFLNERSVTSFEDVSRSIRANTAALLKKCHTPIPRAIRPLSISNQYNHIETPISDRISSDEYIWHLLRPLPGRPSNGIEVGYYPETSVRVPGGKTHLACLSYAGGHPISKRRPLVAGAGDDYRNVRNDVELLSHYSRMRHAADHPLENGDVNSGTRKADAGFKSYTAPTAQHTTEKVLTNGTTESTNDEEEEKENVALTGVRKKSLKKKPSKDVSRDYDDEALAADAETQRKAAAERAAEEELASRLEAERLAEEERLASEEANNRLAEAKRRARAERLAKERAEEEERWAEEARRADEEREAEEAEARRRLAEDEMKAEEARRLAEEARLAQEEEEEERAIKNARLLEEERKAEEERRAEEAALLAEEERAAAEEQRNIEEQQRLLEEQLVEEYIREQERQSEFERQYAEELRRKTEEKLLQEQKILHEKLLKVQQEQERDEAGDVDEQETEEEEEEDGEEGADDDDDAAQKSGSRSAVASDEEPAIAENLKEEITQVQEVHYSKRITVSSSVANHNDCEDEKSENTDANSEISEADEKFESDHEQNKESEITAEPKVESPEESEEESE